QTFFINGQFIKIRSICLFPLACFTKKHIISFILINTNYIFIYIQLKMEDKMMKSIFSGVQPSGTLTLGNYLGAIQQFVQLQQNYQCHFCIVNQHAISVPPDSRALKDPTRCLAALYIAAGLGPEKVSLFVQSDVPAHTELAWMIQSITYMGELE